MSINFYVKDNVQRDEKNVVAHSYEWAMKGPIFYFKYIQ